MLIPIQISLGTPDPIYHQIESQLRDLILSGQLQVGSPLPSIRQLALDLGCSVITTRRVYQDLEKEGLIRTRKSIGTFVADVEIKARERYRYEVVVSALHEAVAVGRRVGCSTAELCEMFEAVLGKPPREEG